MGKKRRETKGKPGEMHPGKKGGRKGEERRGERDIEYVFSSLFFCFAAPSLISSSHAYIDF